MQRGVTASSADREAAIASALLAWYDRERRHLPWRAEPGETPDPYKVWLSEIMLQQTTVKAVLPRYGLFLKTWPDVTARRGARSLGGAWLLRARPQSPRLRSRRGRAP
jgi:adenine-specific DNA glycosylase